MVVKLYVRSGSLHAVKAQTATTDGTHFLGKCVTQGLLNFSLLVLIENENIANTVVRPANVFGLYIF